MEAKIILGEDFNIVVDYLWSIGIGTILIGLSYIAKSYFDYKNTRFQTLFTLKEHEYNIMKSALSDMRTDLTTSIIPILTKNPNKCTKEEIIDASVKINNLYTKESKLFETKNYLMSQSSENKLIEAEKKYRNYMLTDVTSFDNKQLHDFLKEQYLYYSEFSNSLYKIFKLIVKKLAKDLDISK
ncbi:MAG: hypothetical protein M0R46_18210 [Candidatus Muirbacterium halophilum]|nr:hypothetical protein [Candidatus Muirbacterium halophilum]